MIPIRDTIPSRNYPVVTTAIIGINLLVYLMQLSQGGGGDRFVYIYGLVPARYVDPRLSHYFTTGQQLFSLFSFMFLHGGFWHLLGNMWSLWIFGDNVEDRLGPLRYLVFYLACGLASGLSHLILNTGSNVPTIGASGAIAGVMGAYFILYPRAKVLTLVPIIFIPLFFEIPAYFFLGFWFLLQFLNATAGHGTAGGIAWWAHIGGFMFGIIFLKLFQMLPGSGVGGKIRGMTRKRTTPRLQVIRPAGFGPDPNFYAPIAITEREALFGVRKLINIPQGFKKRPFFLTIPPDVSEGTTLRLKGLGRQTAEGLRGDLYLKVQIRG